MGGDSDDILRSLRRYVAYMLGSPPWTVRIQRTRVADDERPVAVVEESAALSTPHSRAGTVHQGDVQKMQTYTVVCYPGPIQQTAADARKQASDVRDLLDAGFTRGLVTDDAPPKRIGAPWRIPIYDFEGVPATGPNRKGPDAPYMYANVDETFNVRPIQDPMDELRFTVAATLRVTWWQSGRTVEPAPIAEKVTGTFRP